MKISGKQIIMGAVCLAAILLQCVILRNTILTALVPWLAFFVCSLLASKNLKSSNVLILALTELVLLPFIAFAYSRLVPSSGSLLGNILIVFAQTCICFAVVIFINYMVNKEKRFVSAKRVILLILLILVYSLLEALQAMQIINAMAQAMGEGTVVHWIYLIDGSVWLRVLSETAFYLAVFCASVRFTKEG